MTDAQQQPENPHRWHVDGLRGRVVYGETLDEPIIVIEPGTAWSPWADQIQWAAPVDRETAEQWASEAFAELQHGIAEWQNDEPS